MILWNLEEKFGRIKREKIEVYGVYGNTKFQFGPLSIKVMEILGQQIAFFGEFGRGVTRLCLLFIRKNTMELMAGVWKNRGDGKFGYGGDNK